MTKILWDGFEWYRGVYFPKRSFPPHKESFFSQIIFKGFLFDKLGKNDFFVKNVS